MPRTLRFMRRKDANSGGSSFSDASTLVNVSHEHDPDEDIQVSSLEGHLRVSTERTYQLDVPHFCSDEGKKQFDAMSNPLNQCGPLFLEEVPVVTGSDYQSFMAAFNKRCNTVHTDDIEDDVYNAAYDLTASLPARFDPWEENEVDRARWMAKFDPMKRQRMEDAYHEIPNTSVKHIGTKELSVKHETLIKRNDPSWAPRVIYAGSDVFNAVTGPAAMVAMERFNTLLATGPIRGIETLTAYKQTDTTLASFVSDNKKYTHIVEGDYSANDKHQRKRVHLLFDKFLSVISMPSWLRELLRGINRFKVQSRHYGLTATLDNQLPTGTTFTTCRNSYYNWAMFVTGMQQQKANGRALILGDDLLAAMDKAINLRQWVRHVDRFKMVLKAKNPLNWGDATFLSRRLICDREEPCMVPLLGKALCRFNTRALFTEDKTNSQYIAGKALSYAYEFRHVPFMRDFFLLRHVQEDKSKLSLDDLTWTAKISGVNLDNLVPTIKNETVLVSDEEFRDWLMETYDLGLTDLEDVCETVLLSDEMTMVEHPAVANLSRDWA
uniref:RNA-dependent RNA polymerase n=1 Tax=Erysiphe necator associated abispo virus 9 TaxID=2741925 RepID=A0A8E3YJB3_9VIRU|nr:RNA-dependent RNA polymerase [Erysiphe necator associated abispo virus 9]